MQTVDHQKEIVSFSASPHLFSAAVLPWVYDKLCKL